MGYKNIECSKCKKILVVNENDETTKCVFCGHSFSVVEEKSRDNIPGDDFPFDVSEHNVGAMDDDFVYVEEKPRDYIAGDDFASGNENTKDYIPPVFLEDDDEDVYDSADFVIENEILKRYEGSSKNVVIPCDITQISKEAFADCKTIVKIKFPASLRVIGSRAFAGCVRLESVDIPEGVTEIGEYAFEGCVSLVSVVIPEGVTEIKSGTFNGCTHLEKITIPDSLKRIGERCFEIGSKPKCVYVNNIKTWKNIHLGNYTDGNPLYPAGKLYVKGVLVTDDI